MSVKEIFVRLPRNSDLTAKDIDEALKVKMQGLSQKEADEKLENDCREWLINNNIHASNVLASDIINFLIEYLDL